MKLLNHSKKQPDIYLKDKEVKMIILRTLVHNLLIVVLIILSACFGSGSNDDSTAMQPCSSVIPNDNLSPKLFNIIEVNPETYRDHLEALKPGDWLQLSPGTYNNGLRLRNIEGTSESPIVISGPTNGEYAVFEARSGANTVTLRNTAHIVIRHLHLDGRKLNVAAVVADAEGNWNHHITLEHLVIRNHDGSQGNTGITTRAPAWGWIIRNNDIRHVGTGLYLGQPDGSAPFIGGLIENNFISSTLGYNMQIKHQNIREEWPGMPDNSSYTTIRYNVFSKANDSNSGSQARPNLLVGHWPPEGPGVNDQYLIYANLFHENPYERLFQGEGNIALYNNLFINHNGGGLNIFDHNDEPKNVKIIQNTILTKGPGIRINSPNANYIQLVAGNAIFSDVPSQIDEAVRQEDNYIASFSEAENAFMNVTTDLATLDLYPSNQDLVRKGSDLPLPELVHLKCDYNFSHRDPDWSGAYASQNSENPGRSGVGPQVENCKPCH